jgi:hypothetical protein
MRIQYTAALVVVESLFVCSANIRENVSIPRVSLSLLFDLLRVHPYQMVTDA